MALAPLPIDDSTDELLRALNSHQNLVLVAEPGAGKTTRFAPLLLKSGLITNQQKILMLEPRRIAAKASAERIAEEQGWKLGREIGYQVRFEKRTSQDTQIEILTEGLLMRKLQSDSELKDVGAVILDEFHERSQYTDLALGLLSELQLLARPDLRIIVMSATIDAEKIAEFLSNAPVVRVPGRQFPIEIHYEKNPLLVDTGPDFIKQVSQKLISLMQNNEARSGDIMTFLPGVREIRATRTHIGDALTKYGFDCFELHGNLNLSDQSSALRPKSDRPRIILTTNVAETSLTVEGIGTVLDSGLARKSLIDAAGFVRLETSRISQASARQRAGRAGRLGPGKCYRLWNKFDEASMPPFETPEIFRCDLIEPLLTLVSQGQNPTAFSWFEAPAPHAIARALETLTDLEFLTTNPIRPTDEGLLASQLPLNPRLSRLMIESAKVGHLELGTKLAALLSEKDFVDNVFELKRLAVVESDLVLRLQRLNDPHAKGILRVAQLLGRQFNEACTQKPKQSHALVSAEIDDIACELVVRAFPDRIARLNSIETRQARMVAGSGIRLAPFSAVERSKLFVALRSQDPSMKDRKQSPDPVIAWASHAEVSWIEAAFASQIKRVNKIEFDEETLTVWNQSFNGFRDLPLSDPQRAKPDLTQAWPILRAEALKHWTTRFLKNSDLSSTFARIEFLQSAGIEVIESQQMTSAKESFLDEACFNEHSLRRVLEKPLGEIFLRHLPRESVNLLQKEAPDSLTVPSGSRIRIQYPSDRSPYIEVRIQEIFGLRESPKLAQERSVLQFHLLGPNYKPMQITSDLVSFWKTGYLEVRKELRARYPKHSWPDDPLQAVAVAKGRPRQSR